MCMQSKTTVGPISPPCPSKLVARKSPSTWRLMLWTPLEFLLVSSTLSLGFAAMAVPTRFDLPVPGSTAAVVQGVLVLLHSLCEGPRLQILPVYLPALLLAVNATGVFGGSTASLLVVGAVTLSLASISLLLCYQLPRVLPINGRGPYDVAIATEHIGKTAAGDDANTSSSEEELWPLELMAQVFYPVEKSCMAKLPWFPSTINRFRRSLVPAWGSARRIAFGLTQAGFIGSGIILASAASRLPGGTLSAAAFVPSSVSSAFASAHAWALAAALALCLTCLVSDVRLGYSRSAYKARYLGTEQARRIAMFSKMPGWLTEHLSTFNGPGFEAGHFHGPDLPCFPVAPLGPGESKRPLAIFSHGLGGNRAMYSALAAEIASYGYVAVFLEHNDASGSSCVFPCGRVTGYVRPPTEKAVPEHRVYRLAQLKRRGREVRLVRAHLAKLSRGVATDFETCRRVGLGSIIDTKRPAFIGHSFGGATVLQVLNDERSSSGCVEETGYSLAFVMDPWTFPICDEARGQSIAIPVIFITTDGFLGAEGKVREDVLVEKAAGMVRDGANHLAIQFRVRDAEHSNFSDTALFAPEVMRKMKNAGKIDGITFIDQVTRLQLCAMEVFLRRRTESGDEVKTPPSTDLSSTLVGSGLADVFPEAWVRKAAAGGVLPLTEMCE